MSNDAKQCPHCQRWALKDDACNYIFACGLETSNRFQKNHGCGKSWCWGCGKKYCGQYYDPATAQKLVTARDNHDANCCQSEKDFKQGDYCGGGCSPHCSKRW
jgi:hypothetical protein